MSNFSDLTRIPKDYANFFGLQDIDLNRFAENHPNINILGDNGSNWSDYHEILTALEDRSKEVNVSAQRLAFVLADYYALGGKQEYVAQKNKKKD